MIELSKMHRDQPGRRLHPGRRSAELRGAVACAVLVTAALGGACSTAAPPPATAEPAWVGLTRAGVPAGLHRGSSTLLEPLDGDVYGLVEMTADTGRMVWLEKQLGHEPDGDARWQVMAVLPLPALADDEFAEFAGAFCTVGGIHDPEVVAVVKEGPGAEYLVQRAWRAQRAPARFEPLNTAQVECVDPGHEVD